MTNALQSIPAFSHQFNNPTGSRLGFYGASSSIGGVLAVLICPFVIDRFGRRWLVFAGAAIVICMGVVETCSTSFYMFAVAKLCLGFGSNIQQIGAPTLVVELAHPKQRQTISSLYNTSLYIGEYYEHGIQDIYFRIRTNVNFQDSSSELGSHMQPPTCPLIGLGRYPVSYR